MFDTFELISLAATFPGIYLAVVVLMHFLVPAYLKLWSLKKSRDWLRLGIAAGFLGSTVDNAFWFIAWSVNFLGLPQADSVFQTGVFFNIPFRQGALILSAYAHIRAVLLSDEESFKHTIETLNRHTLYFTLAGLFYAVGLLVWKYML